MTVQTEFPISITHGAQTRTIQCRPGERLLLAGLRQGVRLPYSCATGTCGECRARTVSGEVTRLWPQAPGARGCAGDEVLLCQASASAGAALNLNGVPPDNPPPGTVMPDYQNAALISVQQADAITRVLTLRVPRPLHHAGGQFVLLRLPGVEGWRAYSIANYLGDPHLLRLVIRHKANGQGSHWLFENARGGESLRIYGPLGRACLMPSQDQDLAMVVGGSGISVAMGVIEHALATDHFSAHRGRLFFGVRAPGDAFFATRLERYVEAAKGRLHITIAFSDGEADASLHQRHPLLHFDTGFVHEVATRQLSAPATHTTAFLAGPEPMVNGALRALLLHARIPAAQIRYDKFT